MTPLLESLESIETTLLALSRKVVQLLKPGLAQSEIDPRFFERRLAVHRDLVELYMWRNGTDATTGVPLDDLHLVPGFYLLSLDDALANYDAFVGSDLWRSAWFPVLANGGGDFLVQELSDHDVAPIRHFRIDETEHPIEYQSLADMFSTFVAAYQRGTFYVDVGGYLEMDDDAYARLARALNPDVPWWTD